MLTFLIPFYCLLLSGVIYAFIFYFFRLGIIISGTNICIGLHNYFQGLDFDFIPMYSFLAEFALPDTIGFLITLLQIGITIFFGKFEDLFT
jgi:hypothetical protein